MTQIICKASPIVLLLTFSSFCCSAQKFLYGVNVGYATVKYSFPVEKDRYYTSDIDPFNTVKVGASVQYALSGNIRFGTGLQYMSIKGKNDGGKIQGRIVNPNGDGNLTFDVNNSFLVFPVEFTILLSDKKIRPALSGGLQFFKALDQNIIIHIEPSDPDPYFDEVSTEIDKDARSSYFGAKLGAGAVFSASEKHEFSLMIFRNFNKSRYDTGDQINGVFEKHEIAFNMWEVAFGWNLK